jgi:hypothetical protein
MNNATEVMATWEEIQTALPELSDMAKAELSIIVLRHRLEHSLNEGHELRLANEKLQSKVNTMASQLADTPILDREFGGGIEDTSNGVTA